MATITSAATGNFSAGATWVGGVAPGTGDDAVVATGHTVTVNTNTTVLSVQSSGGTFNISNGVTLTCTATNGVLGPSSGSLPTISFSLGTGNTVTIVGNVVGSTAVGVDTVRNSGAGGILNVTGNITGGSTNSAALTHTSTGRTNITGNVTGGSSGSSYAVRPSGSAGRVDIVGNVIGGAAVAFYADGAAATTINIIGNVSAGSSNNGLVIGAAIAVVLSITGTLTASTTNNAVRITSATVTPTVISGNLVDASNGYCALNTINFTVLPTVNGNYSDHLHSNGTSRHIRGDAAYWTTSGNVPVAADVRYGTSYGSGTLTGTLRVPDRNSVAYGALVDNTTGLAWLAPSDVSSVIGAAIAAALDSVP